VKESTDSSTTIEDDDVKGRRSFLAALRVSHLAIKDREFLFLLVFRSDND
jgi:hypothetical protein